jgi:hypothetical protein
MCEEAHLIVNDDIKIQKAVFSFPFLLQSGVHFLNHYSVSYYIRDNPTFSQFLNFISYKRTIHVLLGFGQNPIKDCSKPQKRMCTQGTVLVHVVGHRRLRVVKKS